MTSAQLPRGHLNAIKKFCKEYPHCKERVIDISESTVLKDGNFFICAKPIQLKDLPVGKDWKWAQVKLRNYSIQGIKLSVSKLVPKQTDYDTGFPPQYKIWKFQVKTKQDPEMIVMWCERGIIDFAQLNIDDYKFLSDFMSNEIAQTLWPCES